MCNQDLEPPTLLGEVNTTARLTCLAVWKPTSVQQVAAEPEAEATTSQGEKFNYYFILYLCAKEEKDAKFLVESSGSVRR